MRSALLSFFELPDSEGDVFFSIEGQLLSRIVDRAAPVLALHVRVCVLALAPWTHVRIWRVDEGSSDRVGIQRPIWQRIPGPLPGKLFAVW